MRGLNLSTKHQVKKNISDILFFPDLFRNRTELPPLLGKRCFMLATLTIFAFNRELVLCTTMTHSAMQTTDIGHRLIYYESLCARSLLLHVSTARLRFSVYIQESKVGEMQPRCIT